MIRAFSQVLILLLAGFITAGVHAQDTSQTQPVTAAWSDRLVSLGGVQVRVGAIRTLVRGVRSPLATGFRNGEILLCTGSKDTGTAMIRSLDRGYSWCRQSEPMTHLNAMELSDGGFLAIDYRIKPRPDEKGVHEIQRWSSSDKARSLQVASPGLLKLPVEQFDPARTNWFHGNLQQLSSGAIVTLMQGEEVIEGKATWRTFLVRSDDAGANWQFVSMVADHASLEPIRAALQKTGWRLHGAVEPHLLALDDKRLLAVIRVMDDESDVPLELFSPPSETYHDLSYTISGDGMYPGLAKLPADRYFMPGARSAPLIIARSDDGGKTWSKPEPMNPARGCFPRMARGEGVIALSYGGGAGALRWGNFVCFSFDEGKTWTDEITVGPFLTTGYTSIVQTDARKFVVFFDCTPPQPWTNSAAHWIGAVDIEVINSQETKQP